MALPASVGLLLLREPLVQVLFEHGAFDPTATQAVSGPLTWYTLAALADALCQPFWRVVYAQRRMWTVAGVNGLQTGIRFGGNIVLSLWLGYNGLALSAALGLVIQLVVLGWLTWRSLGAYWTPAWWRDLVWITSATALLAAVVLVATQHWHTVKPMALLLISSLLGGLTYAGILLYQKYSRNFSHAINPSRLTEDD
jgi:putative peptidoglycan lipid II flippase